MSKCYCGQVEIIPLGAAMCNYGGEVHAVTACSADWKDRAEKAEAAVQRVRQVAERFASESGPDPYGFGVARAVAADAVLDALDGDG